MSRHTHAHHKALYQVREPTWSSYCKKVCRYVGAPVDYTRHLVAPLCEEKIQTDLENRASSSPVQVGGKNAVFDNPPNGLGSLNFLADTSTMTILHKNMQSMQFELRVLRKEQRGNHSESWQQLQIHDSSRLNNVNNVILSDSPPRLEPVRQLTHMQPVIPPQTVMLNTLRTHEDSCSRSPVRQPRESRNGTAGDLNNISIRRSVKSGRDRTGADASCRVTSNGPARGIFYLA